jgi:hypothetical protein
MKPETKELLKEFWGIVAKGLMKALKFFKKPEIS